MKTLLQLTVVIAMVGLTACADSSDSKGSNTATGDGNGKTGTFTGVEWESIPTEFNPRMESVELNLSDIQKVDMNLFGFSSDVQVQESSALPQDRMVVQLYTVSKDAKTSLNGLETQVNEKTLLLRKSGSHQCSLKTQNRKLTFVKGACYVRVVLTIPFQTGLAVYNRGQLIEKRTSAQ